MLYNLVNQRGDATYENYKSLSVSTLSYERTRSTYSSNVWMLDEKKEDKTLSKYDLFKKIPEYLKNYPFLSEVDSCSLRNSITDLMIGFERYYKKLGGYPNYQKRGVKESYRTNCNRSSYKGKEIILTERLKVKEMLSKEKNPKSVRKRISNVSFQTILQTIEYKCKWSGKTFHQIST